MAETSERSAQTIQNHADSIQQEVRQIAGAVKDASATAIRESKSGAELAANLESRRADMLAIASGSDEILDSANQAERAALEAQRGAELVASAAEEQSAACIEGSNSYPTTDAGARSVSNGRADACRSNRRTCGLGTASATAAEEISASAEELSRSGSRNVRRGNGNHGCKIKPNQQRCTTAISRHPADIHVRSTLPKLKKSASFCQR